MTEIAPVSNIGPCDDEFVGRLLQDFCRVCEHALGVHRRDRVCSVCSAVVDIRADVYLEINELREQVNQCQQPAAKPPTSSTTTTSSTPGG